MRNREEIIEALNILQETCNEADSCFRCPLSDGEDKCVIRDCEFSPGEWDIKRDELWKAFYY